MSKKGTVKNEFSAIVIVVMLLFLAIGDVIPNSPFILLAIFGTLGITYWIKESFFEEDDEYFEKFKKEFFHDPDKIKGLIKQSEYREAYNKELRCNGLKNLLDSAIAEYHNLKNNRTPKDELIKYELKIEKLKKTVEYAEEDYVDIIGALRERCRNYIKSCELKKSTDFFERLSNNIPEYKDKQKIIPFKEFIHKNNYILNSTTNENDETIEKLQNKKSKKIGYGRTFKTENGDESFEYIIVKEDNEGVQDQHVQIAKGDNYIELYRQVTEEDPLYINNISFVKKSDEENFITVKNNDGSITQKIKIGYYKDRFNYKRIYADFVEYIRVVDNKEDKQVQNVEKEKNDKISVFHRVVTKEDSAYIDESKFIVKSQDDVNGEENKKSESESESNSSFRAVVTKPDGSTIRAIRVNVWGEYFNYERTFKNEKKEKVTEYIRIVDNEEDKQKQDVYTIINGNIQQMRDMETRYVTKEDSAYIDESKFKPKNKNQK